MYIIADAIYYTICRSSFLVMQQTYREDQLNPNKLDVHV